MPSSLWRKLIEVIGICSGEAFDHVGEVGLWVDALSLGADEQRVDDGAAFTCFGVPDEQVVLLSDGAGTDGILDEVMPPPVLCRVAA